MSESGKTRKQIEHPAWCDRERCTTGDGPAPVLAEYKIHGQAGEHLSKPVELRSYRAGKDLHLDLSNSLTPWSTAVFLNVRTEDDELRWGASDETLMDLFDLLAVQMREQVQRYPEVYAERFGWLLQKGRHLGDDAQEVVEQAIDSYMNDQDDATDLDSVDLADNIVIALNRD